MSPGMVHPNRPTPPEKTPPAPKPDRLPSRPGAMEGTEFPIVVPRASRPAPPAMDGAAAVFPSPVRAGIPAEKPIAPVNPPRETGGVSRDSGTAPPPPASPTAETASDIPAPPPEHARLPLKTADETGLDVQALVWSPEPGDRMAVINGEILRVGGAVADGVVEFIGGDYVVIRKEGERWRLPFQVR